MIIFFNSLLIVNKKTALTSKVIAVFLYQMPDQLMHEAVRHYLTKQDSCHLQNLAHRDDINLYDNGSLSYNMGGVFKFKEMMKMVKLYLVWGLLLTSLFFAGYSRATAGHEDSSAAGTSIHFKASCKSKVEPVPLNRIHSWIFHVETLDGKPLEKAKIIVYGDMPMHEHGLPTQPIATELGNGDYLVEGLKFSMLGLWKLRFEIQSAEYNETITFNIEL